GRAYLYSHSDDAAEASVELWCFWDDDADRPPLPASISLTDEPCSTLAALLNRVPVAGTLEVFSEAWQSILRPTGAEVAAVVPIHADGTFWGFLGVDDATEGRALSAGEIDALSTAASLFGSAVERRRTDRALEESEAHLRNAQRMAGLGSWEHELETGTLRWSDQICEILGFDLDAELPPYEDLLGCIHPDDRDAFLAMREAALAGTAPYDLQLRIVRPDGEVRVVHLHAEIKRDDAGRPTWIVGTIYDVTERERTTEALRESRERLDSILNSLQDAVWSLDVATRRVLYISPAAEAIYGRPPDAFLEDADLWKRSIHPDDRERVMQGAAAEDGTCDLEYRIVRPCGEVRWVHDRSQLARDADGTPLRRDGIITDITERKRAEEQIRQLNLAVENAMTGIARLDDEGRFSIVPDAYAQWLGYDDPAALVGQSWRVTVSEDDHPIGEAAIAEMLQTGRGERELRALRRDGSVFYKHVLLVQAYDQGGQPDGFFCFMRDVTARREAEEAVRVSEEKLRTLIEHLPVGVYRTSPDGRVLEANPAIAELFGAESVEAMRAVNVRELYVDPDGRARHLETVDRDGSPDGPLALRRLDGRRIWVQDHPRAVHGPDGTVKYFDGVLVDVTAEHTAKEALRASEARNRALLDGIPDAIFVFDAEGFYRDFVPAKTFRSLQEPSEFLGRHITQALPRRIAEPAMERMRTAMETGAVQHLEYTLGEEHGEERHFEARFVPQSEDVILCVVRDITDRIQAQRALRESEERYRNLVDNAPDGIVVFDPEMGLFVDGNPEALRLYGLSFEELCRTGPASMSPPYQPDGRPSEEVAAEYVGRALCGEMPTFEWLHEAADGTQIPCEVRLARVYRDGRPFVRGSISDISERKKVEEALRLSEEKFARAFRASPDAITISRLRDGLFLEVNDGFEQLSGISREEAVGRTSEELGLWSLTDRRLMADALRKEGHIKDMEARFLVRGDRALDCLVSAEVIELAGEPCLVAITRDVTDRKRAEEALRQSEQSFRLMFEHNPLPMWVFDQDTLRFLDVNDAAVAHYGYSREEFLAMTIEAIRPEEDLPRLHAYLKHRDPQAPARGIEWRHRTRDGRIIDVELATHAFIYGDRRARLVLASDITERKRLQREILKISGREQRRIGQDLHDGLGQLLTGIGFRIQALHSDLARHAPTLTEETGELADLVERAIGQSRSLARGLNPVDVEQQGLCGALRELVRSAERLYAVPCRFRCPTPLDVHDAEVAAHVYRIAQEAITNAVKHADPTHLEVRLDVQQGAAMLTVEDDGPGPPRGASRHGGMGLRIMDYRARMIGGQLSLRPAPGGGTRVQCDFPIPDVSIADEPTPS
ncbi:MAG: PAS domain S-box protein, partial [Rhodothermales bacterium]|nr:PAS domain S-box protein [Rhodothermales bacterium]